jgi:sensor domain CHASE-containing protein
MLVVLCRADPQRRAAALETIARGELTMQGPVTLLQGWRGAVARLPVLIANVSRNDTFKCVMTGTAAVLTDG